MNQHINPAQLKNNYFVMRHGQSQANVKGIIVSSPDNGILDFGLSDTGKEQAKAAISHCSSLDAGTLIFSSDFKRAQQTAQIVDQHLETAAGVTLTSRLRERYFGEFELTSDDNYPTVWAQDAKVPPVTTHGQEPVPHVLERVLSLVKKIEKNHTGQTVLLVSHGDTLQILLTFIMGMDPHRHREIRHLDTAAIRPFCG